MRIARLDLIRYGKFTDRYIELPAATQDFHLLVGANEAGKSTVRDAILDLLFGIGMRSTYDFLHPKTEMRLGALLNDAGSAFEFQRIKKARSLLDAQGANLPDDALARFLGNADRHFYDQMFGLDHDRLIAGGNEILKASNDVGRILFQSAAGIGSLGHVRDALEAEADKLWAKRKSGDRAYYVAAEALAIADANLKHNTVRARAWTDASLLIDTLEAELDALRARFRTLEGERVRLERIRRLAPAVRIFNDKTAALASLGTPPHLPDDALKTFNDAEIETLTAESQARITRRLESEARAALANIHVDPTILVHAAAIEDLAARVQQTRAHAIDIEKRQIEVDRHWESVTDRVRQLGWHTAAALARTALEPWLTQHLPPLPVRSAINDLIKRHGAIEQAVVAATTAASAKAREIATIAAQLARTSQVEASPELRAALAESQQLGDIKALHKRDQSQLAKARQALELAMRQLGAWRLEPEQLRTHTLPAPEVIRRLRSEHDRLTGDKRNTATRKDELQLAIAALELDIAQLRTQHKAVARDELLDARDDRDSLWTQLRRGEARLESVADDYETRVRNADALSDLRHDKAHEAASLQGKIEQRDHQQLQLDEHSRRLVDLETALAHIEREWRKHANAAGFPDMPLPAYEEWRTACERVLAAAEHFEQVSAEQAQHAESNAASCARLAAALEACNEPLPVTRELDALIEAARGRVDAATASHARQQALQLQHDDAVKTHGDLSDALAQAHIARADWQHNWVSQLARAGLPESTEVGAAEGALSLFAAIDEHLNDIRKLRKDRIEAMQRDLDNVAQAATALAGALATGGEDAPIAAATAAPDVAAQLGSRLALAREAQKESKRLEAELKRFKDDLVTAEEQLARANARIAPLMKLADVSDREALRHAIERSDQHRAIAQALHDARQAIETGGDGLTRDALCNEIADADLTQIAVRLSELPKELEATSDSLNLCTAKLTTARAERERIAGQDDAARAETARQEALASMANASERFIKVHIGARLLRWAIDRYRETRQGPLLARASEIFAGLTLGSFERLVVDFESDPPTLDGMRPNGATVGIAGMSDGTRDQLYLALRLAALEMHITQAHALPFLADDLFINYDDDRARAGLEALAELSQRTQIVFMTHHEHLVPMVKSVFGEQVNIVPM